MIVVGEGVFCVRKLMTMGKDSNYQGHDVGVRIISSLLLALTAAISVFSLDVPLKPFHDRDLVGHSNDKRIPDRS